MAVPPGRPMTPNELERFDRAKFPAGWRFELKAQAMEIPVFLLLNRNAPFAEPKIALASDRYYLKWPHVEEKGVLCLRDGEVINHLAGMALTHHYIGKAEKLVGKNFNGQNSADFIEEFYSYWQRWCDRKPRPNKKVLLLAEPGPPTRDIHIAPIGGYLLACDTIKQGVKWVQDLFPEKKITEDTFCQGLYLWLKNGLTPEDYPKTNAGVAALVRAEGSDSWKRMLTAVPDNASPLNVVFGFESGNGPALGALCLNEPEMMLRPGKKNNPRFNGFRQKGNHRRVVTERYFSASGKTDSIPVQRIDRPWIFERGSMGFAPELERIRIGIIGCGSLGAQITMHLAQSGIRRFLFVDPDRLSVDNIARHFLGGRYVDQPKVAALQSYLQSHFPGMMDIDSQESDWESVFHDPSKREQLLSCDLLVTTVGSWDAESALNHCFNGPADLPPIVYGWTEPYGFVGHALLVTGIGGCFACGMDNFGKFRWRVTNWASDNIMKRAPACGVTYQPYGVIDIVQTQAMITRLCMDFVTGKIKHSVHWAWFGDIIGLKKTDGELREGLLDYYGEFGEGFREIKRDLPVATKCRYGH